MSLLEVKVPDIGDFKDVPIIEVLVKAGDAVQAEDALITLESDKATMDVPAPAAGVVREVKVKVGDRVGEGSLVLMLEAAAEKPAAAAPKAAPAASAVPPRGIAAGPVVAMSAPAAAPVASTYTGPVDIECDMMVLGAGPGGYSGAFRAADLGMKVVLIERYATLGGVCLNVGCIPSKALLHSAAVLDEARTMGAHGISFAEPTIDLDKLRDYKNKVIGKLTGGLAGMAKGRKVQVVQGVGQFIDPYHIGVETSDGKKVVKFKHALIAAGSQAVKLPFMPEDPRVVDSTG
ncbi:MAG: hypothetical protein RIR70_2028, partial [Pseudomonadota bacterium]